MDRTAFKQRARGIVGPLVRACDRAGCTPLGVTLAGTAINGVAGLVAATGRLRWAALLLLVGSGLDMVDGDLARLQGSASKRGAFLDSSLDRLAETLVLAGLAWFYMTGLPSPRPVAVLLILATLAGSLVTSYARARAEGLGTTCTVGLLQRPERIVLLGIGLLIGWRGLEWILGALAVLTLATAIQRVVHVARKLASPPPGEGGAP
jgi:CDP-diacylglycerol--glycerol-3-phosphate 3-phosphatidyltransferase